MEETSQEDVKSLYEDPFCTSEHRWVVELQRHAKQLSIITNCLPPLGIITVIYGPLALLFSTGFAKRRTDTNLTTIWNSIKTQGVCKPEGERGRKAQKIKTLNWRKEEVENDSIPISCCSGDNYKSIPIHLGWAWCKNKKVFIKGTLTN